MTLQYVDPLSVDPHSLSYEQHDVNIEVWIAEAAAEHPDTDEDSIAWDIIRAYVDSMLGEKSKMGREILRCKLGI